MLFGLCTGAEKAEIRELRAQVHRLAEKVVELSTALSTSSNAALRVHVDEVESALETLQRSNRRELGKLWKSLGLRDEPATTPEAPSKDAVRAAILGGKNHLEH
jgi:hypothetical protein